MARVSIFKFLILWVLIAGCLEESYAGGPQATVWQGTDGSWTDGGNWNNGLPDTVTDQNGRFAQFNEGGGNSIGSSVAPSATSVSSMTFSSNAPLHTIYFQDSQTIGTVNNQSTSTQDIYMPNGTLTGPWYEGHYTGTIHLSGASTWSVSEESSVAANIDLGSSGNGDILSTSGNLSFSGLLSGSGGLSVQSSLILNGIGSPHTGLATVRSSSILRGTAASSIPLGSSISLAGGALEFINGSAAECGNNITLGAGGGTISAAEGGAITLTGQLSGTTGLSIGAGTIIMGSGKKNYSGGTILSPGTTLGITQSDLNGGGVSFGTGSTLDVSRLDISTGSQTYSTGTVSSSPIATLVIAINSVSTDINAGYSSIIDLGGSTLDLHQLTLNITAASPSGRGYQPGQIYTLFTNVQDVSGSFENIVLSGGATGVVTMQPTVENNTLKFILNGSFNPPPSPSLTKNGNLESMKLSSSHATLHTMSSILSHSMGIGRNTALSGGETGGGFSGENGKNPFRAPSLTGDFLNVTDRALAHATEDNRRFWSPAQTEKTAVWVQPFGMTLRQVSDVATPGYKTRTAGVLAGFDHKFRYDIIGGAAIGYARTNQNFDANAGKGNVKDKFLSLFGTWFWGPWYVEGSLLMGLERYQGVRNTGINNIFVSNHHEGYQFSPHVGGGYTFDVKGFKLKGFSNVDFSYSAQYGYQESGPNGIYWNQNSSTMLRTEVGGEVSKAYEFTNVNWKPVVSLSGVNKKPLRKGKIISPSAGSFESTMKTTTNLSPGLASTWQFEDGYSFSAAWMGEFGSHYNLQEAFLKFSKKL